MLRQISTRQFAEWRAYADLEPFDEGRADLRAGQIVQAIVNSRPTRGRGSRSVTLKDCVLRFVDRDPAPRARTPEEARKQFLRGMELIAKIYGPRPGDKTPEKRKR